MMSSEPRLDGPLAQLLREDSSARAPLRSRRWIRAEPRRAPALFPEEAESNRASGRVAPPAIHGGPPARASRLAGARRGSRALLNDEQRVPRWPAGLLGSITHTHGWCARDRGARRAFRRARQRRGSRDSARPPGSGSGSAARKSGACSRAWASRARGLLAKALFSARRAFTRRCIPRVRVFLDFQAMHIELEPGAAHGRSRWQAELQVPLGAVSCRAALWPGAARHRRTTGS
jgi:hypothetical protein